MGKAPAIVVVHGFPRTSLMWRFLAPSLAENHAVICVDLSAASAGAGYDPENTAVLVKQFLSARRGVE